MRVWCGRLGIGLLLIAAKGAFAYTCDTVTTDTVVQPKDMNIQRDLPVGSLIAEVVSDVVTTFKCSNDAPSLTYQEAAIKAYGTYAGNFDSKRVYKTDIEGIGYSVGMQPVDGCGDGKTYSVDGSDANSPNQKIFCDVNGMFAKQPMKAKALIRFYKTAQTTGTGSVSAKRVGAFILKHNKTTWQSPEATFNIGTFKVNALSCTVSNTLIPVDLGQVNIGAFQGPGTSPADNRTRAFGIPLTCAKGTSINLQLDGTAHDAAQGMLKLDPEPSSAGGVAIQLLYDDKPLALAERLKWKTADADGNYTIPLKARYVQTDNSITAGVANGSATFVLTYQ